MSDKTKHAPVAIPEDEVTFQSCATEFFRWVRKAIDLAEETPTFLKVLRRRPRQGVGRVCQAIVLAVPSLPERRLRAALFFLWGLVPYR